MSAYPTNYDNFREIENLPGVVYDEDNKKTFYAEDIEATNDAILAIEQTVGLEPGGAYTTVAARIGAAEEVSTELTGDITNLNSKIYDMGLYQSTETIIGKWTDNRPIYRKVVDFGYLPNNTGKSVAHGIPSPIMFMRIEGVGVDTGSTDRINFPYVSYNQTSGCALYCNATNIYARSNGNYSAFSIKVILEYTRT